MKNFFSSRWGIIGTGAVIGILAVSLQKLGNPANMGICVACFERDIAGALGLHRAAVVQFIRPEIAGFVLGSFIIAIIKKEYQPRAGSSTFIRFFLGIFAMIGALVFLGCPWRALLRLSGGDWNAIVGLAGLIAGIAVGVVFLKNGFSLGRNYKQKMSSGWVFPAFMVALLILLFFNFRVSDAGPLFFSEKGPGAQHAPLMVSLAAGLFIGAIAQRSRFCTMGSLRDIILAKDFHLATGVLAMLVFATIFNLAFGQFKAGFEAQPVAHTVHLWNFMGMALAGLAFALAGGCPGRQLILSGEGDSDAAVFVMGMIVGAGISHNFLLASSPKGTGAFGPAAVVIGIIFCLIIGFTMREKVS
ncbi:MAG TPA: YedE family putative selenium transporter [Spirochaetota bacterium]|nr:YedE family putative selenium transporter [Spirochaetota bacterium]